MLICQLVLPYYLTKSSHYLHIHYPGIIVQAYKYIQKGIKYMNEGKYSKALDKYCVINPAEIPVKLAFQLIHNKGICFAMLENYDEAIHSFQQSLQLEHKHCSSMGNMAFTLMITHNFSDALEIFQEMVQLDNIPPPRLLTVLYGMAECRLHAQSGSQQSIASPTETSKDSTDSPYRNYWSPKSHTSYDGKQQPIYEWYVNPMRSTINNDKSGSIKPKQQAQASTALSLQSAVDEINSPQQALSKMRRDQLQKAIQEFESNTNKLNGLKCASVEVEHKQAPSTICGVLSPSQSYVGRGITSISKAKDIVLLPIALPPPQQQNEVQEQLKSSSNDLPSLLRNTSIKGTKDSNIVPKASSKALPSVSNKNNAAASAGFFLLSDDFFKTSIMQTAAITVDLASADKPIKHKGNTCAALKALTLSTANKYSSQSSTSSVSVDSATMENTKVFCYMDTPGIQARSTDSSSPVDDTSGKTYTSDTMVDSTEEYDVDTGRLLRPLDNGKEVEAAVEYTKMYTADKLTTADNNMMYKKVHHEKEFSTHRFVANGSICTVDTEASTSSNNCSMFKTLAAIPERFPKQSATGYKPRTTLGAVSHDYSRSDFFSFVERMNRSKLHGGATVVTTTNEEEEEATPPFDHTVKKSSFTPVPRFSVIPKTRDVEKYVLDQARIFDHRQRVDEYVTTSSDLLVPALRGAPEETTAVPMAIIKSSSTSFISNSSKAHRSSEYYPYALLRTPGPFPVGIDVRYRELYLNDAEFESVFGTLKKNWSSIPLWKQISMKKAAGLF